MRVEFIFNTQKELEKCVHHFDCFKRRNDGIKSLPPGEFTKVQDTDNDFVNIINLGGDKFIVSYKKGDV